MAWVPMDARLGVQPITTTQTTAAHPLGTIVRANDPTYGYGEFIYLLGLTGTVAGLVVTYSSRTGVTALGTTSGVVEGGAPVAVAMSANIASQYGWYQVAGDTVVLKTAVAITPATVKVYLSATAGRLMPTSVAGRQVIGARWAHTTTVTSTTSTAIVTLNRPSLKTGTLV
jgi:hypothetical protein